MKRLCYLMMIAGIVVFAACSSPPPAGPRNEATMEGPAADSIKMFFDAYSKGDWTAMRSVYHDTAAVFHNASIKLTADSIISFHKSRRDLYDKVETQVFVPLVLDLQTGQMKGQGWRLAWADLNLTVKGSGEVVRVPINIAWRMAGGKVVEEHAFYNTLGIFQAVTKAQQAAAASKK